MLLQLLLHRSCLLYKELEDAGRWRAEGIPTTSPNGQGTNQPATAYDVFEATPLNFNYGLVDQALANYEAFHNMDEGTATLQQVQSTSAGLLGWAGCLLQPCGQQQAAPNLPSEHSSELALAPSVLTAHFAVPQASTIAALHSSKTIPSP